MRVQPVAAVVAAAAGLASPVAAEEEASTSGSSGIKLSKIGNAVDRKDTAEMKMMFRVFLSTTFPPTVNPRPWPALSLSRVHCRGKVRWWMLQAASVESQFSRRSLIPVVYAYALTLN